MRSHGAAGTGHRLGQRAGHQLLSLSVAVLLATPQVGYAQAWNRSESAAKPTGEAADLRVERAELLELESALVGLAAGAAGEITGYYVGPTLLALAGLGHLRSDWKYGTAAMGGSVLIPMVLNRGPHGNFPSAIFVSTLIGAAATGAMSAADFQQGFVTVTLVVLPIVQTIASIAIRNGRDDRRR